MQAISFYLSYPLIYAISRMPFGILYKISDVLFYIIRLSGYRKKVVIKNLQLSFPSKTTEEIEKLCSDYYRYLCDLLVESLKTLNMNATQAKERCVFHNQPWLEKLYHEKQSIMIIMGHYGNWEWAGPGFTLSTKFQLVVVYRPLSNPYFEKMMTGMRTRFGTQISPVDRTLRDMVSNKNKITATAFIADQTATSKFGHWMTFLNQDTVVFTGPDKLAQKFNYPVVYMKVTRPKRGYYEVIPELLFERPKDQPDNTVIETFMRRLEKDIIENPVPWLWSHRRWKHKKRVEQSLGEPIPAL